MPEHKTLSGTLEVRHVPDGYTEQEIADGANWPLGAGHIEVGVNVDGAFVKLARLKAGGVLDDIARAKSANNTE